MALFEEKTFIIVDCTSPIMDITEIYIIKDGKLEQFTTDESDPDFIKYGEDDYTTILQKTLILELKKGKRVEVRYHYDKLGDSQEFDRKIFYNYQDYVNDIKKYGSFYNKSYERHYPHLPDKFWHLSSKFLINYVNGKYKK